MLYACFLSSSQQTSSSFYLHTHTHTIYLHTVYIFLYTLTCTHEQTQTNQPLDFIDKRTYRGVAPTCHDINQYSSSHHSVRVAVGFTAGQVQIIDVRTKQSLNIMNEDVSTFVITVVMTTPRQPRSDVHVNGEYFN